ncbi:hypothetical protein L1887_26450 [Cichorium endivia]|nr:hypothetical protein L1887_26450 [Cichorium endivia]
MTSFNYRSYHNEHIDSAPLSNILKSKRVGNNQESILQSKVGKKEKNVSGYVGKDELTPAPYEGHVDSVTAKTNGPVK